MTVKFVTAVAFAALLSTAVAKHADKEVVVKLKSKQPASPHTFVDEQALWMRPGADSIILSEHDHQRLINLASEWDHNDHPVIFAHEIEPYGTTAFWTYIGIAVFLTCFAGLMSGLTVGYLSIDKLELEIKMEYGTAAEKKAGATILPVLLKHHWLLVTLLLCNAAAMEALPIFLDAIMPSFWAIIVSVTAVLFFGEVIPQAVCTGPSQMMIAENITPVIKCFMWGTSIISWPIAKLLDMILGEHGRPRYNNDMLRNLLKVHNSAHMEKLDLRNEHHEGLTELQNKIIDAGFNIVEVELFQIGVEIDKLYKVSLSDVLDE